MFYFMGKKDFKLRSRFLEWFENCNWKAITIISFWKIHSGTQHVVHVFLQKKRSRTNSDWIEQDFKWPCCIQHDGDIVYWRHKAEPLKKLTDEERKEIWKKENGGEPVAADTTYPTTVSSSPRKERPLRIFLDTPTCTNVKEEGRLD